MTLLNFEQTFLVSSFLEKNFTEDFILQFFKRHFVQKIATAIYKTSNKNFSTVDSAKIVDLSFLDVCQMLF